MIKEKFNIFRFLPKRQIKKKYEWNIIIKKKPLCHDIHSKYIVVIDNQEYCKKCDYGYLETLE